MVDVEEGVQSRKAQRSKIISHIFNHYIITSFKNISKHISKNK